MDRLRYALARLGGTLIEWAGYNAVLLHPTSSGLVFQPSGLHVIEPSDYEASETIPGLLMTMALVDAMRSDDLHANVFNAALVLGYPYDEAVRMADMLKPLDETLPEDAA